MSTENTVLVTGAAGYLASWVVAQLLEAGQTVHGTVRTLSDASKIAHLHDLSARFPGKLHLFEADLLADRSFDAAIEGCNLVIHVASPYFFHKPKDAQAELIQPALDGTLNLIASVNRVSTVTRVVLTSSIVALFNDARDLQGKPQHQVQEADINGNTDISHNPYAYSKTRAEQAAWQAHAKQSRWELITVHPGGIFGPSLSKRADATSVEMMLQFLDGTFRSGAPRLWMGFVDVRDVAAVHVKAALLPNAKGRYIAVAQSLRLLEIAQLMKVEAFGIPNKLPRSEAPKALMWLIGPLVGLTRRYVSGNVGYPITFNTQRSQTELGVHYRAPADTLNAHIKQIVADGLLVPK